MLVHVLGILVLSFATVCQLCTVPDTNSATENSLPKKIEPDFGEYPQHQIKRWLSKNKDVKFTLKKEAAAMETKCLARERKFSFPLPEGSQLEVSQTCLAFDTQVEPPTHVELDGLKCWVLKPWAGQRCFYIKCSSDNCDVPPPGRTIPVDDQYKCRPTDPRILKVYAYCGKKIDRNNSNTEGVVKVFEVPLPKCCSCLRFQCLRKG